jgi:hypothetical protein
MMNHEEILYDWISARETRLSAARTVSGFCCEYAEPDDPETGGGVDRCYRHLTEVADYCGGCQQRVRLYPGLVKLRELERRAFRRLCRSALRFKQRHDAATSNPARLTPLVEGKAIGSAENRSSSSLRITPEQG